MHITAPREPRPIFPDASSADLRRHDLALVGRYQRIGKFAGWWRFFRRYVARSIDAAHAARFAIPRIRLGVPTRGHVRCLDALPGT